jgi:hypothetical protein
MSVDRESGASAVAGKAEIVPCGMVARPLDELPPELRPRRVEPGTADGDYDVLHYMR